MSSMEIFQMIVRNIHEIVPGLENEAVNRESMLSPLGLDSIGRAELIEMTLEDLQLVAPRWEFHIAHNLGELADMLAAAMDKTECVADGYRVAFYRSPM